EGAYQQRSEAWARDGVGHNGVHRLQVLYGQLWIQAVDICADGAGDSRGVYSGSNHEVEVAHPARHQRPGHLGLREEHFGGRALVQTAVAYVRIDANDGGPRVAAVIESAADGIAAAQIVSREGLVDNGDQHRPFAIGVRQPAALEDPDTHRPEVVGIDAT